MFDQLVSAMSGSAWTYLLVLVICALDAVLPILPGETMVITGGVLAGTGSLNLPLVMVAGAAGAFLGDTACYWLGRRFGQRAANRVFRGERGRRSLAWAERTLRRRGMTVVAAARFVPGGRTATTFTAGTTRFRWSRFCLAAGIGGMLWGVYNGLLGAVGGRAFEHQTWKGLVLALVLASGITVTTEAARWWITSRRRGGTRHGGDGGRERPDGTSDGSGTGAR